MFRRRHVPWVRHKVLVPIFRDHGDVLKPDPSGRRIVDTRLDSEDVARLESDVKVGRLERLLVDPHADPVAGPVVQSDRVVPNLVRADLVPVRLDDVPHRALQVGDRCSGAVLEDVERRFERPVDEPLAVAIQGESVLIPVDPGDSLLDIGRAGVDDRHVGVASLAIGLRADIHREVDHLAGVAPAPADLHIPVVGAEVPVPFLPAGAVVAGGEDDGVPLKPNSTLVAEPGHPGNGAGPDYVLYHRVVAHLPAERFVVLD